MAPSNSTLSTAEWGPNYKTLEINSLSSSGLGCQPPAGSIAPPIVRFRPKQAFFPGPSAIRLESAYDIRAMPTRREFLATTAASLAAAAPATPPKRIAAVVTEYRHN